MADFILIHGAYRGGWAWDRVVPLLENAGYRAFAPTLAKHRGVTLASSGQEIADLIVDNDLNGCILVGHSQGGIVAQAAAEIVPESIARIIFLDAPVLRNGEAAVDYLPPEYLANLPPLSPDEVRDGMPVAPSEHISAEDAAFISARLEPQTGRPGFDKLRIERSADVEHDYIFCTHTPTFFPSNQARTRFDREGVEYTLIEAPHDCNVTDAGRVADVLLQIIGHGE